MGEDEQQPSLFGEAGQSIWQSRQGKAPRGPEAHDAPEHARPLAARMRPRTLDEVLGQDHLLAPGHALRRALERDQVPSMILWGPPGSGKTTLASVIAASTHARFIALSAVTAGVADLRRVVEDAGKLLRATGQRTILFIDEIHRFSKSQQDAILPHVERGTVILIGATTENPSFEVNAALLSRTRVFTLRALSDEDIQLVSRRALADEERGLGAERMTLTDDALIFLATYANGDARAALNALELAATTAPGSDTGERVIDLAGVEDALQHRALLYDKAGEEHYKLCSLESLPLTCVAVFS
jgi:putative ATPase